MKVVCDIDGVVADPREHVLKYLHNGGWDWEAYFKHTLELPKIPCMVEIVKKMLGSESNTVVFSTGRPESNRQLTTIWLMKVFQTGCFDLIMRQEEDAKLDTKDIKLAVCKRLSPDLVLEDEPRAVELLTTNGFTVLQVHGYRVTGRDYAPGERE